MELSLCSRQNNKKIGPIFAINNKDFNNQYVVEKLINNPPKKNKNINIRGLAVDSKKVKKGYIFFELEA